MKLETVYLPVQYWPLATPRQAKKQAVRLLRAKQYLRERNIEACAINSEFKYSQAPGVLK